MHYYDETSSAFENDTYRMVKWSIDSAYTVSTEYCHHLVKKFKRITLAVLRSALEYREVRQK